jgi:hypothetical protein
MVVALAVCMLFAADKAAKTADKPKVIVGTFDSRSVAIARMRSKLLYKRNPKVSAVLKEKEARTRILKTIG